MGRNVVAQYRREILNGKRGKKAPLIVARVLLAGLSAGGTGLYLIFGDTPATR